jgi:hypothetical protein
MKFTCLEKDSVVASKTVTVPLVHTRMRKSVKRYAREQDTHRWRLCSKPGQVEDRANRVMECWGRYSFVELGHAG